MSVIIQEANLKAAQRLLEIAYGESFNAHIPDAVDRVVEQARDFLEKFDGHDQAMSTLQRNVLKSIIRFGSETPLQLMDFDVDVQHLNSLREGASTVLPRRKILVNECFGPDCFPALLSTYSSKPLGGASAHDSRKAALVNMRTLADTGYLSQAGDVIAVCGLIDRVYGLAVEDPSPEVRNEAVKTIPYMMKTILEFVDQNDAATSAGYNLLHGNTSIGFLLKRASDICHAKVFGQYASEDDVVPNMFEYHWLPRSSTVIVASALLGSLAKNKDRLARMVEPVASSRRYHGMEWVNESLSGFWAVAAQGVAKYDASSSTYAAARDALQETWNIFQMQGATPPVLGMK